jgi:hypothetical protein
MLDDPPHLAATVFLVVPGPSSPPPRLDLSRAPTSVTRWQRPATRSTTTSPLACAPDVAADLDKLFGRARRTAALGLARRGERDPANALPATCPYSLDQIVTQDGFPQNRHGIVDDLGEKA